MIRHTIRNSLSAAAAATATAAYPSVDKSNPTHEINHRQHASWTRETAQLSRSTFHRSRLQTTTDAQTVTGS